MTNKTRVAAVGGSRTPFAKAGTALRKYSALDLSSHAVNGLLDKQKLDPNSVEKLVYGITVVDTRTPQFAREVVFSSQLPSSVRALTVINNCITGTFAITSVYGRAEIGLAGGVESMSNPSVLLRGEQAAFSSMRPRPEQLARSCAHLRGGSPGASDDSINSLRIFETR